MATIKEDYVSFETAKLLKEKGYKGSFDDYYNDAGCVVNRPNVFLKEPKYQYYERVSLYIAMKWLREVHKKWITITFHWHTVDGETTLYYSPYIMLSEYKNVILEDKNPFKMKLFTSYEKACEAAIKYCLENLI